MSGRRFSGRIFFDRDFVQRSGGIDRFVLAHSDAAAERKRGRVARVDADELGRVDRDGRARDEHHEPVDVHRRQVGKIERAGGDSVLQVLADEVGLHVSVVDAGVDALKGEEDLGLRANDGAAFEVVGQKNRVTRAWAFSAA